MAQPPAAGLPVRVPLSDFVGGRFLTLWSAVVQTSSNDGYHPGMWCQPLGWKCRPAKHLQACCGV